MRDMRNFHQILENQGADSFLKMELQSARLKTLIAQACVSKGVRIDIMNCTHVTNQPQGITINTVTPTMANRLKQIQPTIEKKLFDAGITTPITAIRSGKITALAQPEAYPKGEPRIAPPEAAQQVYEEAQLAKDDDVREALERLAQALKA